MFSSFEKFPNTAVHCELVSRATISAIACAFADNGCDADGSEGTKGGETVGARKMVTNARDNDTIGLPPPTTAFDNAGCA